MTSSRAKKSEPGGWRGLVTAITFAVFAITFAALANRKPSGPEVVYVFEDSPPAPESVQVEQPLESPRTEIPRPTAVTEITPVAIPLAVAVIVPGPQTSNSIAAIPTIAAVTATATTATSPMVAVIPPAATITPFTPTTQPVPTRVAATPVPQKRIVVIPFPTARSRAS